MLQKWCLALSLLVVGFLYGQIKEVKNFEEISQFAKPGTLFLLDVDNTLITTVQTLGSDQWFEHRIRELSKKIPFQEALERAVDEWEAVQKITSVILVEPKIHEIVARLQQPEHVVMGFTSRELSLMTRTLHQLNTVDIDLSQASPVCEDFMFRNPKPVLFSKGILFCAGTHKGEALSAFLEHLDYTPKQIVFIDDKLRQLERVDACCKAKNIPFVGLRYGYLDEKVANFSPEIASTQLKRFRAVLSDEEAKEHLEKTKGS